MLDTVAATNLVHGTEVLTSMCAGLNGRGSAWNRTERAIACAALE